MAVIKRIGNNPTGPITFRNSADTTTIGTISNTGLMTIGVAGSSGTHSVFGNVLRVFGPTADTTFRIQVSDTTSISILDFGDSANDSIGRILYNHSSDVMAFRVGDAGVNKGSVDAAGSWTFGTTSGSTFHSFVSGGNTQVTINTVGSSADFGFIRTGGSPGSAGISSSAGILNFYTGGSTSNYLATKVGGYTPAGAWSFEGNSSTRHNMQTASTSTTDSVLEIHKTGTGTASSRLIIGVTNTAARGYIRTNATNNNLEFEGVSDRRKKSNIQDISESYLDKVMAVPVKSFNINGFNTSGFIAQELQPHIPEAVTMTDDGLGETLPEGVEPWTVSEQPLTKYLWKAIQELKQQFDDYVASHP